MLTAKRPQPKDHPAPPDLPNGKGPDETRINHFIAGGGSAPVPRDDDRPDDAPPNLSAAELLKTTYNQLRLPVYIRNAVDRCIVEKSAAESKSTLDSLHSWLVRAVEEKLANERAKYRVKFAHNQRKPDTVPHRKRRGTNPAPEASARENNEVNSK